MPHCSRIVGLLIDYLEGRLPIATHAELDQHLDACPSCVAHVRTYRTTLSLLASLDESDLPPELRTTLKAFLDRHASS